VKRALSISLLACVILAASIAAAAYYVPTSYGDALYSWMDWGAIVDSPPLNGSVVWRREIDAGETNPGTSSVLALYQHQGNETAARYPWTLYAELNTHHSQGADGTAINGRIWNQGSGWGAGVHVETHATASNTTIGVNVESNASTNAGRTIGINVQSRGGEGDHELDQGINLQSSDTTSYTDGIRFDHATTQTGINFAADSCGTRAIWIQGQYAVGLDVGSNPIRMREGTPIQLEHTGAVTLRYVAGRIEFRYGGRVLGYLVTDASANGARMN